MRIISIIFLKLGIAIKIDKRTAVKNFFREKVKIIRSGSEKTISLVEQKNIKHMTPTEEWKKLYYEQKKQAERLETENQQLKDKVWALLLESDSLKLKISEYEKI